MIAGVSAQYAGIAGVPGTPGVPGVPVSVLVILFSFVSVVMAANNLRNYPDQGASVVVLEVDVKILASY